MLKTYKKSIVFTLDGELVENFYVIVIREENEAISKKEEWQGLENIQCVVTNDLKNTIGYRYSLFRKQFGLMGLDLVFLKVKKNSILRKFVKYEEVNLSIDELFKVKESKKVIEYMKQQGITVCPMKA